MAISYRKLFHLLIDKNMKKGELQKKAGITASIMARLAKDETVKSDTLGKICDALGCQPGDIMENIPSTDFQGVKPFLQMTEEVQPFSKISEKAPSFQGLSKKSQTLDPSENEKPGLAKD